MYLISTSSSVPHLIGLEVRFVMAMMPGFEGSSKKSSSFG